MYLMSIMSNRRINLTRRGITNKDRLSHSETFKISLWYLGIPEEKGVCSISRQMATFTRITSRTLLKRATCLLPLCSAAKKVLRRATEPKGNNRGSRVFPSWRISCLAWRESSQTRATMCAWHPLKQKRRPSPNDSVYLCRTHSLLWPTNSRSVCRLTNLLRLSSICHPFDLIFYI